MQGPSPTSIASYNLEGLITEYLFLRVITLHHYGRSSDLWLDPDGLQNANITGPVILIGYALSRHTFRLGLKFNKIHFREQRIDAI